MTDACWLTLTEPLVLTVVYGQMPKESVCLPPGDYRFASIPHPWRPQGAGWLALAGPHTQEGITVGASQEYIEWLAGLPDAPLAKEALHD